ncbi:MAG: FIST N-terminal domain-containing protein [Salegentibacter sp.]
MKAKSISGNSVTNIKLAFENSIQDGFRPTLAFVFISVKQDRKAVSSLLLERGIDVLGATSCGEFINEQQTDGEIAMLLMEISKDLYSLEFEKIEDDQMELATQSLANKALQKFKNPALILCSTAINRKTEFFDGHKMVSTLKKSLGPEKVYYGGMAGDDWSMNGTFVFANENETDSGIAAIVLDGDKIQLNGMAINGYKPMGISRTVTRSKGNLLYEIDGKPAVEMYLKYLGKNDQQDDLDVFKDVSVEYPFIVERDQNETVLVSTRDINEEENALVTDMDMPEGTNFWFAQPPGFDIVEEILEKAAMIKESQKTKADALLVFSCAGRPPLLGPMVTEENEGLARIWNAPMAGFFTYGEYGRAYKGKQNFHSGACCWVALKEK